VATGACGGVDLATEAAGAAGVAGWAGVAGAFAGVAVEGPLDDALA